jgi:hypothetical protein
MAVARAPTEIAFPQPKRGGLPDELGGLRVYRLTIKRQQNSAGGI